MVYNLNTNGVTQSQLLNFLKCRQYSKLNLAGWVPIKPSGAMQFGEMAHQILEDIYGDLIAHRRTKIPDAGEIMERVGKLVKAYTRDFGQKAGTEVLERLEYNALLLESLLPVYFKHWGKEDFTKIKWLEVEKEFSFRLPLADGTGITIKGKRDAAYAVGSSSYLFETKTKSQIDESTITELLAFDFQTDLYSLAMHSDYGKYPSGIRYNILRRPGNKVGKAESYPAFRKRITDEINKKPEYYFMRYKIETSKSKIEAFRKELIQIVTEFRDWQAGKLPTYKNTYSCISRYGTCQYINICGSNNFDGFRQRKEVHPELRSKT